MSDIADKIALYVQSISDADSSDALKNDTEILSLGYVDSFSVVGILNFIEEEFNIEVDLELVNIENFASINSITELVQQVKSGGVSQ